MTAAWVDLESDSSRIRELAEEILSRPEYARAKINVEAPQWLRWFFERLNEFLSWLDGLYASSPILYWLLLAGLLLVLGLLVAHMVWSISRALRDQEPEQVVSGHEEKDFGAVADELARNGRYLEATHQLLLACLQRAAQSGVIELHADDTNGIARTRLEASSLSAQLRTELLQLINTTERIWFRDRSDDPDLYNRWSRAYHDLLKQTH